MNVIDKPQKINVTTGPLPASEKVYINGTLLSEPYIQQSGGWRQKEISLGEDEYWAVGDNRAISEFGKVKRARLAGKILF